MADRPELWARAYRQLQAGAMPPVGSPRPDRAAVDAALLAIEKALGAAAKKRPLQSDDAIGDASRRACCGTARPTQTLRQRPGTTA